MWDPSFMLKSCRVVGSGGGLQDFSVSPGSESTEPELLSLSHWAWVWAWLSLTEPECLSLAWAWQKLYQVELPHPLNPLYCIMILDSFLEFWLCPNWVSSLIMKIINWWDVGISNKKGSIGSIEYFSLTLPSHDEVMGLSWPLIGKIIFRQPDVWTYSGIQAYKAESIRARILINLDLYGPRETRRLGILQTRMTWSVHVSHVVHDVMSHIMLDPGLWQHP